jgi:hypothetical protein
MEEDEFTVFRDMYYFTLQYVLLCAITERGRYTRPCYTLV